MIIFFPFAKVWILLDVIYISTFLSFAPTQKKKKKKKNYLLVVWNILLIFFLLGGITQRFSTDRNVFSKFYFIKKGYNKITRFDQKKNK